MTNYTSFTNLNRWIMELKEHGDENMVIMLVGNKIDLRHLRAVSTNEAKSFAVEKNMFFVEASAVEDINVDAAFVGLIEQITNTTLQKMLSQGASADPDTPSMRGSTLTRTLTKDADIKICKNNTIGQKLKNMKPACCN